MDFHAELEGWVELNGSLLSIIELEDILRKDPGYVLRFGGEFYLKWDGCKARDHFGIIPGDCPPGTVICNNQNAGINQNPGILEPSYPLMDLCEAIEIAVELRADEGVVAFSGGVDSTLVAILAKRECIAVGVEGSHDLYRSKQVAQELGLPLNTVVIDPGSIEDALARVLEVIPRIDPLNASIATTLYFVAEWASGQGYKRILAGQGADELFGGYARYLQTGTLIQDLERDFRGLRIQLTRDEAVAALHNAYFSLPYMDYRVVKAARAIPAEQKVCNGIRKRPLRDVARRYLPDSIAYYEKKAMQYGSGMMKEIQKLASRRGYKNSLNEYMEKVAKER